MTNCVNCGAPIETDKKVCPYCKTPYDVSGFKAEIGEMFGEITIGGKTSRVYLRYVIDDYNALINKLHPVRNEGMPTF